MKRIIGIITVLAGVVCAVRILDDDDEENHDQNIYTRVEISPEELHHYVENNAEVQRVGG